MPSPQQCGPLLSPFVPCHQRSFPRAQATGEPCFILIFIGQGDQSLQKEVFGPLNEVAELELPLCHLASPQGQTVTETACHQQKLNRWLLLCLSSESPSWQLHLQEALPLGQHSVRFSSQGFTQTQRCLFTFCLPAVPGEWQVTVLVLYCPSKTFYCA